VLVQPWCCSAGAVFAIAVALSATARLLTPNSYYSTRQRGGPLTSLFPPLVLQTVDAKNTDGNTPLHYACLTGQKEVGHAGIPDSDATPMKLCASLQRISSCSHVA
jgi:hypothetical protein